MLRRHFTVPCLVLSLMLVAGMVARAGAPDPVAAAPAADASPIARGEYLVNFGSCHDCHTPWKLGPNGPEPDMSRALTGHPSDLAMPAPPALASALVRLAQHVPLSAYRQDVLVVVAADFRQFAAQAGDVHIDGSGLHARSADSPDQRE